MSLLRQWQSHRFLISQTETSQMNTFRVLHTFIVNVKLSAGWIDLKWETLYLLACRLIWWNNLRLPMEHKCFNSVNMSPLSDFFERVKFYDWLLKFSLTAKGINVPGMAAMSHTNILRISEIHIIFDFKDTAVFVYKAAIHAHTYIYFLLVKEIEWKL